MNSSLKKILLSVGLAGFVSAAAYASGDTSALSSYPVKTPGNVPPAPATTESASTPSGPVSNPAPSAPVTRTATTNETTKTEKPVDVSGNIFGIDFQVTVDVTKTDTSKSSAN